MIEYIYIVKCPGYEDEMFNFFTDARMQCDLLMSKKPYITQIEVERNDFGECTDHHDLGTVWSWEEVMKDTEEGCTDTEPATSVFTKDDFADFEGAYNPENDPEFYEMDNSVDCEPETSEVSPVERKPIPEGMTIEQLVEEMEENEDTVECTWCEELFDKSECRKEVDLGWLCSRCEMAIKSRGETLTFREGNYWDFLDEEVSTDDLSTDEVDHDLRKSVANNKFLRIDSEQLIDERNRYAQKTGHCPICGGDIVDMICSHCKNSYKQNGNTGKDQRLIDAALLKSIEKLDPSFKALSLDNKVEYLYNAFFLGKGEVGIRKENETGKAVVNSADRKNTINKLLGNQTHDASADNVRQTKQHIKQELMQAAKRETENKEALAKVKPEDYINHKVVVKESVEDAKPHDLGNEYDGGYPAETLEVSDSHLRLCPECGKETFDIETGICVDCGFN